MRYKDFIHVFSGMELRVDECFKQDKMICEKDTNKWCFIVKKKVLYIRNVRIISLQYIL